MIEFYYTVIMLGTFVGMLLYSRSLPVALVSIYIVYWFMPQGIPLIGTGVSLLSFLGIAEFLYILIKVPAYKKANDQNWQLFLCAYRYVLYLSVFMAVFAVLSTVIPLGDQLSTLKNFLYYAMNILIVALCFTKKREFVSIVHLIMLWVIISGIYGIYTYILRFNPIAEIVTATFSQFEDQGLNEDMLETERGFLQARISGFTVHPLLYGGILVLFIYVFFQEFLFSPKLWKRLVLIVFMIFCFGLTVLTGSRSILIGLAFGIFYFLLKTSPKKTIIYSLVGMCLLVTLGVSIEDDFIRSTIFFWEEHDEIGGSSISMRMIQLEAVISAVSSDLQSLLFGFGRGWVGQYLEKHGNMPPFQGFEGLFLFSIVTYGVLGTILFVLLVFKSLYSINKQMVTDAIQKTAINAYLLAGLTIYVMTGIAYGLRLYMVLLPFMVKYAIVSTQPLDSPVLQENEDSLHSS